MSHRIQQVSELVQHEVSMLLRTEVDFPRNCLVTVTRVEVSKDLRHAAVWISVLPFMYTGKALEAIQKNMGPIQFAMNKRLHMRPLPRLHIKVDDTERRAAAVEAKLSDIRKQTIDEAP